MMISSSSLEKAPVTGFSSLYGLNPSVYGVTSPIRTPFVGASIGFGSLPTLHLSFAVSVFFCGVCRSGIQASRGSEPSSRWTGSRSTTFLFFSSCSLFRFSYSRCFLRSAECLQSSQYLRLFPFFYVLVFHLLFPIIL